VRVPATAYFYDCLALFGRDLRGLALADRKALLRELLAAPGAVRYADHVEGDGAAFLDAACKAGLEGVVAKRGDARYLAGRRTEWRKIKCVKRQEFVIGGYTDPKGTRAGLGAVHLGVYDGDDLVYAGRAGSGLDHVMPGRLGGARDVGRALRVVEEDIDLLAGRERLQMDLGPGPAERAPHAAQVERVTPHVSPGARGWRRRGQPARGQVVEPGGDRRLELVDRAPRRRREAGEPGELRTGRHALAVAARPRRPVRVGRGPRHRSPRAGAAPGRPWRIRCGPPGDSRRRRPRGAGCGARAPAAPSRSRAGGRAAAPPRGGARAGGAGPSRGARGRSPCRARLRVTRGTGNA